MTRAAPEVSGPDPLTAVTAFGDFGTIDYCSLLDLSKVKAGGAPQSSFESCRAELPDGAAGHTVVVGPLAFDADPNIRPYDYAGPVPDGVAVQQSMFNDQTTCTRAVTFADGIRLDISVADSGGQASKGDAAARCRTADTVVGSALAAVTHGKVGRLNFPERSWGRVAPCALLDTPGLDAASGANTQPSGGLSGHSCIRGKLSLDLSVDQAAAAGPTESLGGREATVAVDGAFCTVDTTQPAPGMPGRAEKAQVSVVETAGTAGEGTCAVARSAAASILPRLPRA